MYQALWLTYPILFNSDYTLFTWLLLSPFQRRQNEAERGEMTGSKLHTLSGKVEFEPR